MKHWPHVASVTTSEAVSHLTTLEINGHRLHPLWRTWARVRALVPVQVCKFHLKTPLEWNFSLQLRRSTLSAHANAGGVQWGFRFSVGLGPRLTKSTVCNVQGWRTKVEKRQEKSESTEQKRCLNLSTASGSWTLSTRCGREKPGRTWRGFAEWSGDDTGPSPTEPAQNWRNWFKNKPCWKLTTRALFHTETPPRFSGEAEKKTM